jgi:hypothetical protein
LIAKLEQYSDDQIQTMESKIVNLLEDYVSSEGVIRQIQDFMLVGARTLTCSANDFERLLEAILAKQALLPFGQQAT